MCIYCRFHHILNIWRLYVLVFLILVLEWGLVIVYLIYVLCLEHIFSLSHFMYIMFFGLLVIFFLKFVDLVLECGLMVVLFDVCASMTYFFQKFRNSQNINKISNYQNLKITKISTFLLFSCKWELMVALFNVYASICNIFQKSRDSQNIKSENIN